MFDYVNQALQILGTLPKDSLMHLFGVPLAIMGGYAVMLALLNAEQGS